MIVLFVLQSFFLIMFIQRSSALIVRKNARAFSSKLWTSVDSQGRRISRRSSNQWDPSADETKKTDGWDDFDPFEKQQEAPQKSTGNRIKNNSRPAARSGSDSLSAFTSRNSYNRGHFRDNNRYPSRDNNRYPSRDNSRYASRDNGGYPSRDNGGYPSRDNNRYPSRDDNFDNNSRYSSRDYNTNKQDDELDRKTNMRALEGAGFCHLYGLNPVLSALGANKRDFSRPAEIDISLLQGEALQAELAQRARKPEAQFSPHLFVQDSKRTSSRSNDKRQLEERVLELAQERGIPVVAVDKGVLNTLSGNRPHQGYVLRCGNLEYEHVTKIPTQEKKLWIVLDEVVDPMNVGALLRSAHFLGDCGVLVCAKNSAPPTPVVSAASAGALECETIYSTSNLPKLLSEAANDGFRVIGASSSLPRDDMVATLYDLQDLPVSDQPVLLVLGSEGSGLRTLVARTCTEFVRIPGGSNDGVDSLNVSVTGGILLWHLLQLRKTPAL
jgi:21S rRNA (GM2251-2'-O)-methyltransferase